MQPTQQPPHVSVPVVHQSRGALCTSAPAGWECRRELGHQPPCEMFQVTSEPLAVDPQVRAVPAASVASKEKTYGFGRRAELDVELPSGGFVRVRQLSITQVIKLKVFNMRDVFAQELLEGLSSPDESVRTGANERAQEEFLDVFLDPNKNERLVGPLNQVAAAAVVCPRVILSGESTDEAVNVDEIEFADKWAIFEAAMPNEMKTAALEAQQEALKSV